MSNQTYKQISDLFSDEDEPFLASFAKLDPLDRRTFATIAYLCMVYPQQWRDWEWVDDPDGNHRRTFDNVRNTLRVHDGHLMAPEEVWAHVAPVETIESFDPDDANLPYEQRTRQDQR